MIIDISQRELFCQQALGLQGIPYGWGGQGFLNIDCSGVIVFLFQSQGIFKPSQDYTSRGLAAMFPEVEEPVRGDFAYFMNKGGGINHVALVLRGGKEPICFEAGGGGSQDVWPKGTDYCNWMSQQILAKKSARVIPLRAILDRGKTLVKYNRAWTDEGEYRCK
jgi:hypothetical protein